MNFRSLVASTDQAVLETCGDDAILDNRPVRVIYCEPWMEPKIGTLRTNLTQPMAFLPGSDLNGADNGSVLVFDGAEYEVVDLESDGTGWVGLVLRPK